jgi:hypothetical protein
MARPAYACAKAERTPKRVAERPLTAGPDRAIEQLGIEAYRQLVETQTQRRASRLPMGRPRRSGKVVFDPT